MSLSSDLISQFAKITKPAKNESKESTAYGTIVDYNGTSYVKLDGSDLLTPISTTTDTKSGERVTVTIKDHTAVVTGNLSSPAARTGDVKELGTKISEFEIIIADKISVEQLEAEVARIDTLVSENVTIRERLTASEAEIGTLQVDNVAVNEKLTAHDASIENLDATKIDAEIVESKYATIESLEATDAKINNLDATYATITSLEAEKARIDDLDAKKLSATQADLKYANIDFSNIGVAAIEKLFTDSGIIGDLVVSEGHITGRLVGVTIVGDLIEGGTVKADKLVVLGEDGLYYKLNTNGVSTTAEQTEYNSLNGSVITAKSITAEKVNVDDLVAFDATIGGFNITNRSIYSGAKESVENTTRGIYLDKNGQIAFGDATNFIRYYKGADGAYKLEISAESISIKSSSGSSNLDATLNDLSQRIENIELTPGPAGASMYITYHDSTTMPATPTGDGTKNGWHTDLTSDVVWMSQKVAASATAGTWGAPIRILGQDGAQGEKGDTGNDGVSVTATTVEYYLSTSDTELSGGTWQATAPEIADETYLWGRTKITYSDGRTTYTGAYCISKAMLDSAQPQINSITQTTTQQITDLQQNVNSIILSALESYVSTGDFGSYKDEVSTALSVLTDQISININSITERIDNVDEDLQRKYKEISKAYRFTTDGLIIGESDNAILLRLDNDVLQFVRNNTPELQLTAEGVEALRVKVAILIIGNVVHAADENGDEIVY